MEQEVSIDVATKAMLALKGQTYARTLDDMARFFLSSKVVSSLDEGRQLVPRLCGAELEYDNGDRECSMRVIKFCRFPNGQSRCFFGYLYGLVEGIPYVGH